MIKIFEHKTSFIDSYKRKRDWGVFHISRIENFLHLRFQYDEWSNSYFNDHDTYLKFHKIYKVTSGYWDGKRGHWLTAKRIEGEIMCSNITKLFEDKSQMRDFSVIINKPIFSNSINIEVESKITGSLKFKCNELTDTGHHNIGLYENSLQKYTLATRAFEEDSTFTWKLS